MRHEWCIAVLASHFAVLASDRQIEFSVDAGQACVAAVDPDKLQRVLMNLAVCERGLRT